MTTQLHPAARLHLSDLRAANIRRCNAIYQEFDTSQPGRCWSLDDWAVAAFGEAGEACNLIKKRRRGDAVDSREIGYELADFVCYVDLLAYHQQLELEAAVTNRVFIGPSRLHGLTAWVRAFGACVGRIMAHINELNGATRTSPWWRALLQAYIADAIIAAQKVAIEVDLNLEEMIIRKFNEVSDRHGTEVKLTPDAEGRYAYRLTSPLTARNDYDATATEALPGDASQSE